MRRAVCWCVTRNLYERVMPSIRSFLAHNEVDRVYLLAEEQQLPQRLPGPATVIDVRGQRLFRADGPNYRCRWTWMVLMRAALAEVLAEEDRVLSLDADTITRGSVGALWDLDLSGYCLAGVREPHWSREYGRTYVNMGTALFNLRELRATGLGAEIIRRLNTQRYEFVEQDCINEVCAGRILELPGEYNENPYTVAPAGETVIKHYAADPGWYERAEVVKWRT